MGALVKYNLYEKDEVLRQYTYERSKEILISSLDINNRYRNVYLIMNDLDMIVEVKRLRITSPALLRSVTV